MSKGRKPKKTAAAAARWRPVLAALVTLAAVAGLLYGLARLGDEARRRIGPRDRYTVRFADVECDTPPGLDRPTFLAEVRYAANLPETFNLFSAEDTDRLKSAFAAHPWVAAVEGIDAEPPARVRVRLRFRVPVLAVRTDGGSVRLVAADGVLLPVSPLPGDVAELATPSPPPTVSAGRVWDDPVVRRAVELVAAYRPRRLEKTPTGWRLTQPDGKVLLIGP